MNDAVSDPGIGTMGRRAFLAASGAVAAGLLAGCVNGGSSSTPSAKNSAAKFEGSVEFWTLNLKKGFTPYFTNLIAAYEKLHPKVSIKWVDVPGDDIATKLLATIQAGNPPEVVNIDDRFSQFATALADLRTLCTPAELAVYQQSLIQRLTLGGKLCAIPWYLPSPRVGLYRKSVMTPVGFDPSNPPKTYDDALALAQKIHDQSGGKMYGFNAIPDWQVLPYYGVDLISDDEKKATFNTSEAVDILNRWKTYYSGGAIAPGAISIDDSSYPQTLDNGKLGFDPNTFADELTSLQQNSPNIYKDMVATPGLVDPSGNRLLFGYQTLVVPSGAKNPAAGAEFLKFLSNSPNQLEFSKETKEFPSTVATMSDSFFTDITVQNQADAARKIAVSEMSTIKDVSIYAGGVHKLDMIQSLSQEVRAFLQGQKSANAALSSAEKTWNQYLA